MCFEDKECQKPCVLIVDDTKDIRELLRFAFEAGGFCVSEARTVGEVINKVNEACEHGEACFDVIVMDVDLPDVTGTTLGRWIRERYPNVIIHYLTAYAAPLNREEAKRQGAGMTEKPLIGIEAFVDGIRAEVKASTYPGDRRKRGNKNALGEHRRRGDAPIVPTATLREHIKNVAVMRGEGT